MALESNSYMGAGSGITGSGGGPGHGSGIGFGSGGSGLGLGGIGLGLGGIGVAIVSLLESTVPLENLPVGLGLDAADVLPARNSGYIGSMLIDVLVALLIVAVAAVLGLVVHPVLWVIVIVAFLWLFGRHRVRA